MNTPPPEPPVFPDDTSLIQEAMRLWPDPREAPECPPESTIRKWLEDPASLLPDLAWHIGTTVNSRRAADMMTSGGLTTQLGIDLGPWPEHPVSPASTLTGGEAACVPGEIWATVPAARTFDGEKIRDTWTWQPLPVLLLTDFQAAPWGEIARGLVCSPAVQWPEPFRSADDVLLHSVDGRPWIAHLWLEYPLDIRQLAEPLSYLLPPALEQLRTTGQLYASGGEIPDSLGGSPPLVHGFQKASWIARDRLSHTAAFLSSWADAAFLSWEEEQALTVAESIPALRARLRCQEESLAMAHSDDGLPASWLLLWQPLDPDQPVHRLRVRWQSLPASSLADPSAWFGSFVLEDFPPQAASLLIGGASLVFIHRTNSTVLGHGRIHRSTPGAPCTGTLTSVAPTITESPALFPNPADLLVLASGLSPASQATGTCQ